MGHSRAVDTFADADFISHFIGERLVSKGLLRSPVPLTRHRQGSEDPDSKLVFLSAPRHGLVVTLSPPQFPDVVAQECDKAARMRLLLGNLGAPIMEPLDAGRIENLSYAVLPYREPLAARAGLRWLDRLWVRRHLLAWVLEIARKRSTTCKMSKYEAALEALRQSVAASSPTAALLRAAQAHLASGGFIPQSSPMHGDLWKGNVLHGSGAARFTLIDWRGSETEGFPLFDLIRAAESFGLSRRALRRELQLHRAALGCQARDLPIYLLGALGHYASKLGEMRPELFRAMADNCVTLMDGALEDRTMPASGTLAIGPGQERSS
jgi:hypothetical protein